MEDSCYSDSIADATRYIDVLNNHWGPTPDYSQMAQTFLTQAISNNTYTPPKSETYQDGYLDAASHYKYELKMLLNAIEGADINVGCRPDKFQLAIERARKVADEPLNQIQPEEEIF
jgi:hypothetical protein